MFQSCKVVVSILVYVVFITPVYAQSSGKKEMKAVGESLRVAYRDCTNTVLRCMDECSADIDATLPPCQENCVKAADSCKPLADVQMSPYHSMNTAALANLKAETDACFRDMLVDARKCDPILDLVERIECVMRLIKVPKSCVRAAYKRFQNAEKFPEK